VGLYYGGYPYYGSSYYGWPWGYPYYGWGYYGPRYYYPRYESGYVRARGDILGGLDLNIKPKKSEVYLDGMLIGTAGKYDGYPGYLWVPEGKHRLVFYRPGFATMVRDVEVLGGVVIDLRLDLEPGESTRPEELALEPVESRLPVASRKLPAPRDSPARAVPDEEPLVLDTRSEPARLVLRVVPEDASVYLDGRFLGTGSELSRLHSGLLVDGGDHLLEVVRPGYEGRVVEFSVIEGEEEELKVTLDQG
jgi:hypothetical protein